MSGRERGSTLRPRPLSARLLPTGDGRLMDGQPWQIHNPEPGAAARKLMASRDRGSPRANTRLLHHELMASNKKKKLPLFTSCQSHGGAPMAIPALRAPSMAVGRLQQHLSHRLAARWWGHIAGLVPPGCWLRDSAAPCWVPFPHAPLALLPLLAKHMVSLSSFFVGNRDGRGISCFHPFASERLRTRKKVQK